MKRRLLSIALMVGFLAFARFAAAQESEFGISGGYSHFYDVKNHSQLLFNKDGGYIDGDFAWKLPNPQFPLRIGFGLTVSGTDDERDVLFPLDDAGDLGETSLYSDVAFFAIEPRIALPIRLAAAPGFFIKPRLGMGLLISSYAIDYSGQSDGNTYFDTHYHTGVAFEIRPAVQAGYSWGDYVQYAIGVEMSYMPAWGDFGRLGSSLQELRAGVFFNMRY